MKVFFLSIWNNCSSNRRGSSWLRGIAVRFTANLARNCKLRTPSSVLKGFIRVTCLGEVREVLPYLKAFFLHACWETISFEKHCWKHLPLIFAPSLGKISSRKLFLLCRFSLSYEYFSRICARERGFLAEKHSLLFWAAHRLPIVWAVIVPCRCCFGSRLHTQHPQSYRSLLSLLSSAAQLFWRSWFLTTAEPIISKPHCPQDL